MIYRKLPDATLIREAMSYCPETGECFRRTGPRAGKKIPALEQVKILQGQWILARLIWKHVTGCDPTELIDHINRKNWDNRWVNLREATRSQNNQNCGIRKDNTSGIRGVSPYQWDKTKWCACIRKDGILVRSPVYASREEAVVWRKEKQKELFGDYAGD